MSEEYERMMELREPLLRLADAAEQIAGQLARRDLTPADDERLTVLERILWDLYPQSCQRAGLDRSGVQPSR